MILEGRATHPGFAVLGLAASSASSPGPNSRIRPRWESIPEPTRSGSNAQCRRYTWLCPNTARPVPRQQRPDVDWNSSATPTSPASRRSVADPSFPSRKSGFFGPHVHARSSTSASTPAHDFPQSESTSPGRCPANKTQGVRPVNRPQRLVQPRPLRGIRSEVHLGVHGHQRDRSEDRDIRPGHRTAGVGPGSNVDGHAALAAGIDSAITSAAFVPCRPLRRRRPRARSTPIERSRTRGCPG